MTQQSAFVNKLRRVREQLCNGNCCFDICRVSFKSARNHTALGGGGWGCSSVELYSANPSVSRGKKKKPATSWRELFCNLASREDSRVMLITSFSWTSFCHCKNIQELIAQHLPLLYVIQHAYISFISCHARNQCCPFKKWLHTNLQQKMFLHSAGTQKIVQVKVLIAWVNWPPQPRNTSVKIIKHCIPKAIQRYCLCLCSVG